MSKFPSDQLCPAGSFGPSGPHLVKHNVFGYAMRQSMSLSACRFSVWCGTSGTLPLQLGCAAAWLLICTVGE